MADLSREEIFGTAEFLPKLVEELDAVFPQVSPLTRRRAFSDHVSIWPAQRRQYLINKLDQDNV